MDEKALRQAAGFLKDAGAVLVFAGAGLSAESGVPTFRDAGGLWEGHRVEDVATPEGFQRDPILVWRFYAERQVALQKVKPNPGHFALARMEHAFPSFLVATQNIDNLSEQAGQTKLVKIHGDLMTIWCTRCSYEGVLENPINPAVLTTRENLPRCPACQVLARPAVVWFGEYLPPNTIEVAQEFAFQADCLLMVGTSGAVSGGYGLADIVKGRGGKVIEINPSETYLTGQADIALRGPSSICLPSLLEISGR